MKRICVFCGSSTGIDPVYGGGNIGLMGILADVVLKDGGEVIGVIPQALVDRELAHRGVTELRIVESMHERKALMADLADAFVALPGGYGTLEEFCEVVTWSQLGFHPKLCGLLNIRGFYDPFLAQIQRAIADGFIQESGLIRVAEDPARLLDDLLGSAPVAGEKWIGRDER